jgi:FolB domain-containing protein
VKRSDSDRDSNIAIPCHALRVEDLRLQVRLGCEAGERARVQEVRITIEFRFAEPPKGFDTDSLQDVIDYAAIASGLRRHIEGRDYHLIERVANDAFQIARDHGKEWAKIGIRVHKVRPPVEGLSGGSVYQCGDFLL